MALIYCPSSHGVLSTDITKHNSQKKLYEAHLMIKLINYFFAQAERFQQSLYDTVLNDSTNYYIDH
ncbi:unnamed protein product, partial [Nesidiocoris tenuis]